MHQFLTTKGISGPPDYSGLRTTKPHLYYHLIRVIVDVKNYKIYTLVGLELMTTSLIDEVLTN